MFLMLQYWNRSYCRRLSSGTWRQYWDDVGSTTSTHSNGWEDTLPYIISWVIILRFYLLWCLYETFPLKSPQHVKFLIGHSLVLQWEITLYPRSLTPFRELLQIWHMYLLSDGINNSIEYSLHYAFRRVQVIYIIHWVLFNQLYHWLTYIPSLTLTFITALNLSLNSYLIIILTKGVI